ncbi:MAG: GNAT family N-acetyltransferase [Aggregatilineales bacterium]
MAKISEDNAMKIRQATATDADWLQSSFDNNMGWTKPSGYFVQVCEKQSQADLVLLIATIDDVYAGHLKIIWQPNYPYFRENDIPEIQDLNVVPDFRRRGIATALMDEAESRIKTRAPIVGIGFGLYADYGAAQRMYVLRGYIPDGHGVAYDDKYPTPGTAVRLDDDLVLHLIKQL